MVKKISVNGATLPLFTVIVGQVLEQRSERRLPRVTHRYGRLRQIMTEVTSSVQRLPGRATGGPGDWHHYWLAYMRGGLPADALLCEAINYPKGNTTLAILN
jgi:hypothetical protein